MLPTTIICYTKNSSFKYSSLSASRQVNNRVICIDVYDFYIFFFRFVLVDFSQYRDGLDHNDDM